MVITMAKLRMGHASMHGARKPPGPIFFGPDLVGCILVLRFLGIPEVGFLWWLMMMMIPMIPMIPMMIDRINGILYPPWVEGWVIG